MCDTCYKCNDGYFIIKDNKAISDLLGFTCVDGSMYRSKLQQKQPFEFVFFFYGFNSG